MLFAERSTGLPLPPLKAAVTALGPQMHRVTRYVPCGVVQPYEWCIVYLRSATDFFSGKAVRYGSVMGSVHVPIGDYRDRPSVHCVPVIVLALGPEPWVSDCPVMSGHDVR